MLSNFNRNQEILKGIETEYAKFLFYDFDKVINEEYKSYQYYRLCTIVKGEKQIEVNNSGVFTYSKNEHIILPPNSKVKMTIEQPTQALVLELSDHLLDQISEKISNHFEIENHDIIDKNIFIGENSPILKSCINKIQNSIIYYKDQDIKHLLDFQIQEITFYLLKNKGAYQFLQHSHNHPISKALILMKDNLQPPISIENIAYNVNLSLSAFSRKFKQMTGISPNIYYTNLKLEKAKELISYKTIAETAWDLGFENVSYFIKIFRTKFGETPKQMQLKNTSFFTRQAI